MIGDYIFVFTFNMGIFGAGLATAVGSRISFVVMLSHFWSKKNMLVLRKPTGIMGKLREILVTGFSTFFIDIAMGILTVLFNRQIMKYLGSNALAIYGPVINISTIVQCCAYSVGQAAQPIISINFFSTYYFQVLMKPRAAFCVSVFRGCIVSGILIMLLPIVTGANSIWFAMPITELLVAVYAIGMMSKYTKALSKEISL